jgi:hypothetical protein
LWGIRAIWIDLPAFTMNPSTELFLVEMHRLFAEQIAWLDRLFDKHIAPSTIATSASTFRHRLGRTRAYTFHRRFDRHRVGVFHHHCLGHLLTPAPPETASVV